MYEEYFTHHSNSTIRRMIKEWIDEYPIELFHMGEEEDTDIMIRVNTGSGIKSIRLFRD